MKKNRLSINDKGQYEILSVSKKTNKDYSNFIVTYLNTIKPLFDKAKTANEFEYACALIGFKQLSDPGWDTFKNTIDIFDSINKLKEKTKDSFTELNLFLWVYGHIIEASQPYELYANLLRIIDGKPYIVDNFPDKVRGNYTVPQFPVEKIEQLKELASKVNLPTVLDPIVDVFDKNLRNSIFHSDYSVYQKEIRAYRRFTVDESYLVLNKALAYYESFKILYQQAIRDYETSKVVELPTRFSYKQGALIVRKKHGLIGVKDNLTIAEINSGSLPFHMGMFKYHEIEILKRNPTISEMPIDRTQNVINFYNKLLNVIPKRIEKLLRKLFNKYIRNIQIDLISRSETDKPIEQKELKKKLYKTFKSDYTN